MAFPTRASLSSSSGGRRAALRAQADGGGVLCGGHSGATLL